MGDFRSVDDTIKNVLLPRLPVECQRLDIPAGFIQGVFSATPKPFEYDSFCEPVEKDGIIVQVRIRINDSLTGKGAVLRDFWHEMYHAKEYFQQKRSSELGATWYAWKRYLGEYL